MSEITFPAWVTEHVSTEQEKASAIMEYKIRLLALNHNRTASLPRLAEAMGVAHIVLYTAIERGDFTAAMATQMEKTLGRDLAPKENFCSLLG